MKPNQICVRIETAENGYMVMVSDGPRQELGVGGDEYVFTEFDQMSEFLAALFVQDREMYVSQVLDGNEERVWHP